MTQLNLNDAEFGLAGCAAIDELREAFLRWVESEKLPSGRADDLPDATTVVPSEKPPHKEASRPSRKHVKSVRKLQRPQTVALPPKKPSIPNSAEPVRAEGTEGQSAPSSPAPRRWLFAGRKHRPRTFFTLRSAAGSRYGSGRSKDWLKFKNPAAPAVKRDAEEEWGRER